MGIVNAVLCITDKTMRWVLDETSIAQWGRIEDSISLGRMEDAAAIVAAGEAYLAEHSQPKNETVVEVAAIDDAPVAGDDYSLADTVDAGTVEDVRVSQLDFALEAKHSRLRTVPGLSTASQEGAERAARLLDRIIVENGGRSGASAPPLDFGTTYRPGRVQTRNVREWSWRAAAELDDTGEWQPFVAPEPARLYEWRVDAENGAATDDSIFEFSVNGTPASGLLNLVLGAGETSKSVLIYAYEGTFHKNWVFRPSCSQNGGHTNGAVQLRAADVV